MTENTFPFEAGSADEPETDRRKLALVAGAGALAVAVLGYFVVVPMLGGGDSATEQSFVRRERAPQTAKKNPAKPVAKKPVAQPQTYADTSARVHPFRPLVVARVQTPTAVGGGTPVGAPPAAPAPGTTTGSTTGAPSGSTGGSSTTVTGQRVALQTIFTKDGKQVAQTKVGDTVHNPVVGEVFAGSYKLLAISGKTATYLFGDEQFTLTVGQEVLK